MDLEARVQPANSSIVREATLLDLAIAAFWIHEPKAMAALQAFQAPSGSAQRLRLRLAVLAIVAFWQDQPGRSNKCPDQPGVVASPEALVADQHSAAKDQARYLAAILLSK